MVLPWARIELYSHSEKSPERHSIFDLLIFSTIQQIEYMLCVKQRTMISTTGIMVSKNNWSQPS